MAAPPNSPPLILYILYQFLAYFAFALLLIPTILYRSVLHLHPATRPYPTWSLRRDLAVACGRLFLACTTFLSLPRPPAGKAWREDALVRRRVGGETAVKAVTVPPVPDAWIVGAARVGEDCVRPVDVPCFWTFSPAQGLMEGDERASAGERVVLYVAGGCVLRQYMIYLFYFSLAHHRSWVMGHPQSTPFPYKICSVSGHRVLGACARRETALQSIFVSADILRSAQQL